MDCAEYREVVPLLCSGDDEVAAELWPNDGAVEDDRLAVCSELDDPDGVVELAPASELVPVGETREELLLAGDRVDEELPLRGPVEVSPVADEVEDPVWPLEEAGPLDRELDAVTVDEGETEGETVDEPLVPLRDDDGGDTEADAGVPLVVVEDP